MQLSDEDLDLATRTVYGEARGEPYTGKLAVAHVIANRVKHPRWWGRGVFGVCRKRFQFSCWNPNDPNRPKIEAVSPNDPAYIECARAVRQAFAGLDPDPTRNSDHYFVTRSPVPSWAKGREPRVIIGAHSFYGLELPAAPAAKEGAK